MVGFCRLLWCALAGLFRPRASLEAEILVLRHQLNILRRRSPKRPVLSNFDRLIFAGLYSMAPNALSALTIVKPETVIRWHRRGFQLYWRWKSKSLSFLTLSGTIKRRKSARAVLQDNMTLVCGKQRSRLSRLQFTIVIVSYGRQSGTLHPPIPSCRTLLYLEEFGAAWPQPRSHQSHNHWPKHANLKSAALAAAPRL